MTAALSMALHHQVVSGKGQYMLTSMITSNAWASANDFCAFEGKRPVPVTDEDYLGLDALHRVYEASEGWVCLHVDAPSEWQQLAAVLELDLADGPGTADIAVDGPLEDRVGQRLASESAEHWERLLTKEEVPCVAVFEAGHSAFTSTDLVLRASGRTLEADHPLHGNLVRAAPPMSFSRHAGRITPNCLRGEHNDAVLGEFGIDQTAREHWVADGILFPPDPVVPFSFKSTSGFDTRVNPCTVRVVKFVTFARCAGALP